MDQRIQHDTEIVAACATEAGMKVVAAIAFWLIGLVGRMLRRVLERQKVDPTLILTRAA